MNFDENFISILSGAASGLITVWLFFKQSKISITRERYKKLIFPMFDTLEPYLFQPLDNEASAALKKVIDIYFANKKIAGGKLAELIYYCTPIEKCKLENYISLCNYINHEYDKCCRKIGIPLRRLSYRYSHRQFKTKFGSVLYIVTTIAFQLIVFCTFLFVFFILLGFFSKITKYLKLSI